MYASKTAGPIAKNTGKKDKKNSVENFKVLSINVFIFYCV